MKVFIVDSNYPSDHYSDRADGAIAQQLLKALGIKADLRLALDRKYFSRGIRRALKSKCDVLHISCHGDDDSIGLCSDRQSDKRTGLSWAELAELFENQDHAPKALVMSACCGASTGIGKAFIKVRQRPSIIIGSTEELPPADYVAAWALLYRKFKREGIEREVARKVLTDIAGVVDKSFRYLRWDDEFERYRSYPLKKK